MFGEVSSGAAVHVKHTTVVFNGLPASAKELVVEDDRVTGVGEVWRLWKVREAPRTGMQLEGVRKKRSNAHL